MSRQIIQNIIQCNDKKITHTIVWHFHLGSIIMNPEKDKRYTHSNYIKQLNKALNRPVFRSVPSIYIFCG